MKISENWLRTWVNPAIDSEKLSDQLTMLGLEVDDLSPAAKSFTGVVVEGSPDSRTASGC